MGMKNPKTCIIPRIPHSPGMGISSIGNPGIPRPGIKFRFFIYQISIFRIINILSKIFIKERKTVGFRYSVLFYNIRNYFIGFCHKPRFFHTKLLHHQKAIKLEDLSPRLCGMYHLRDVQLTVVPFGDLPFGGPQPIGFSAYNFDLQVIF